jgi:hypothetical protein
MPGTRHPAELEGYLEGVARRLHELRQAGTPREDLEEQWRNARSAFRAGQLPTTDRVLRAVDAELDLQRTEQELTEIPRGLVGYVAKGDRGTPPGPEEEPLANRLRLLARLAGLRQAQGHDVAEAIRGLDRAQTAYRRGDRVEARREADRAHALLEREVPTSGP